MNLPRLLDIAPCGYFRVSEHHELVALNHTLLGWLGYTRDELIGEPLSTILTSASRLYYLTHLLPALQSQGLTHEQQLQLRGRDGDRLSVLLQAQRNDEQEQQTCYDCVVLPFHNSEAQPSVHRAMDLPRKLPGGDAIGGSFKAALMRGGSSKGLFVLAHNLPNEAKERDELLLRAMGSPDPYGTQMDGLGGGTSSTSKVIVVDDDQVPEHCQLSFRFGAVAIDQPLIDWSGNCGNLTAAVVPFAVDAGLITPPWTPDLSLHKVRLWQSDLERVIEAAIPVRFGELVEDGDFILDGVAFPAAEVPLTFLSPGGANGILPTGTARQMLNVKSVGSVPVSLVDAGNPTVFVQPESLGITGTESRKELDGDDEFLTRCEAIRATAAVAMGLAEDTQHATRHRPHIPKLAWVTPPTTFETSDGQRLNPEDMDVLIRMISMGRVHHAITGTGSIAAVTAAAIPDTIVARQLERPQSKNLRIAHTAGRVELSAWGHEHNGQWQLEAVSLSRSARVLMRGTVRVPPLKKPQFQPLKP